MSDLLYLSGQYIRHHKVKIVALVFAITLVSWLPIAVQSIVDQTASQLLTRAENTPMVIGAKGSPLELSLGSLYFSTQSPVNLTYNETTSVESTGMATAIPLYYRFHSQGHPIVGTTPDYMKYRQLNLASGRMVAILGEAVIGADVSRKLGLAVGDSVISSPESVFDLAGIYPLKMTVVGILKRAFSPDDSAIFVDLKTSWVIQGLGHGHQDLNNKEALGQILKRQGSNIVANASVRQYNEITAENIDSFHFHSDNSQRPISAVIPLANDKKSAALLLGHYLQERTDVQIVRSRQVISALLDTVFTVRDYIVVGIAIVAVATATIALLVFFLSLRLRQGERQSLARIGASRWQINFLMASEVITVILVSTVLATLLVLLTEKFGMQLLKQIIVN